MTKEEDKKDKPTFIMVPRKLVVAIGTGFLTLFILFGVSIQYTNYVDRKSNQQFCGLFKLSDTVSAENPNPNEIEQQGIIEIQKLLREFHCT